MSAITKIQWTDRTWNPVRGCSVVSPGCVNCYAMKFAHRFNGPGKPYEGLTKQTKAGPQWTGQIRLVEDALLEPLKWRKPARVFVNSMSDLFHEGVPDAFIDRVFAVMALASRHTFQVLTKRPERMRAYLAAGQYRDVVVSDAAQVLSRQRRPFALPDETVFDARRVARGEPWQINAWPLPNVWLGVSVEDQQRADERIPLLLQTPAAVRFISAEPLLGPVNLGFDGVLTEFSRPSFMHWVICGGESGPGARPCDVSWVRSIVRQCADAGVPVFVKQLGRWPSVEGEHLSGWGVLTNEDGSVHGSAPYSGGTGKHGDPSEWPEDLRVREFPA